MSGRVAALALLLSAGLVPACARGEAPAPAVRVECRVLPQPPRVGPATVEVRLADAAGAPVRGATVGVEGNMNHAGMVPSIATTREVAPGCYEGALEFTMGGDWFLLIDVRLADGAHFEEKVDVPGVAR